MNFSSVNPAILLDIALVLLLIATMVYYRGKGLVAGLLDLVGNLAALSVAWVLSGKFSPNVFENFFKSGLIESTAKTIQEQGTFNFNNFMNGFAKFLPDSLVENLTDSAGNLLNSGAPDIAQQIVEQVIAPLIVPIITVVVFFATYAVCKLILAFLVATLTNINHIPIVGGVNRTLGMLVGVLAGGINILLALCLLFAIVALTGSSLPVVNEQALSGSFFYAAFAQYNPFI
ncbi:MAG: hypothetical protein RSD01_06595 [Ruthenibacterium sp.]